METPDSPCLLRIRWIRALDILQYSLFVLGLFLLVPPLARDWFNPMTPWYLVPAVPLAAPALLLPSRSGDGTLDAALWRLRVAALLGLGLSPFVYWYRNAGENLYLLLGAFLGVLCFFWYLGEYTGLLERTAGRMAEPDLERRARLVRQAILYLGAVPLISLHVSFLIWPIIMPHYSFSDLVTLWFHTPVLFVTVMTLPPVLLFLYITPFRRRAMQWPDSAWEQAAQPSDHRPDTLRG